MYCISDCYHYILKDKLWKQGLFWIMCHSLEHPVSWPGFPDMYHLIPLGRRSNEWAKKKKFPIEIIAYKIGYAFLT